MSDGSGEEYKDCEGGGPKPPSRPSLKAVGQATMGANRLAKVVPAAGEAALLRRRKLKRSTLERTHKRFRVNDLYYSALDLSWAWLCLFMFFAYGSLIAFWAVVSLSVSEWLDGSSLGLDDSWPKLRALCWAAENVITMGSGKVGYSGMAAFVLATAQHMCGICGNVLLFTVVATKFQKPVPCIIFSRKIVVGRRDGVPTLQIRFANKRCNLIFHPEARVTFMRPVRTREGELIMKSFVLDVPNRVGKLGVMGSHPCLERGSSW